MNWKRKTKYIIGIIIVVGLPLADFLFGPGILPRLFERKQIFCGIEQRELRIPSSLLDEMKSIVGYRDKIWVYNIFVKNDSRSVCMNPIITIRFWADILGHAVNETKEDKKEVEESISIDEEGVLTLKLKRLAAESFVDVTVWADSTILDDSDEKISFSSDSDFEMKTKLIWYSTNEKKFR